MGRKPIGTVAMTDAERQRRSRENRGIGAPQSYFPQNYPWDFYGKGERITDWPRVKLLDEIEEWLSGDGTIEGNRDVEAVAVWLAHHVSDAERWDASTSGFAPSSARTTSSTHR